MQPENDHPKFEQYLRQFQPRPPAPLPQAERGTEYLRFALAIAALVLVASALTLWTPPTREVPDTNVPAGPAMLLGRLNTLLNEDPEQFDAALVEASQRVLPDVQRPGGALWVLSKD